jgi:ketosteroid isomerase-like protein
MKRVFIVIIAVVCGYIGVFAQAKDAKKDQKKEDKKEVKTLIEKQIQVNIQKLVKFSIKANVDSLADLYSPSCYFIKEYGKRIEGRDELQKKFNGDFKSGLKITEMNFSSDDLKIYDDMVLEIGILTVKFASSAGSANTIEKSNYLIIWKKSSDGKFRIRSEITSPLNNPCK